MQGVAQGSWHLVSGREGGDGARDLGSGSGDGSVDRGISGELSQCGSQPSFLFPLAGAVAGLGGRVAVRSGRRVVGIAGGLVGAGVGVLAVGGGGGGAVPLGGDLVVAGVEALRLRAVEVEPPVADEVLLVEDGAVGAEEGLRAQAAKAVGDAHVEHLAVGRRVRVVTCKFGMN